MKIISKLEASLLGLKHYFTGISCRNGHLANRLVSTGACVECAKINRQKYAPPTGYARGRPRKGEVRPISVNAVKIAEYRKKRLAADPKFREAHNQNSLAWQAKNPERTREIARESYHRNKTREKINDVQM